MAHGDEDQEVGEISAETTSEEQETSLLDGFGNFFGSLRGINVQGATSDFGAGISQNPDGSTSFGLSFGGTAVQNQAAAVSARDTSAANTDSLFLLQRRAKEAQLNNVLAQAAFQVENQELAHQLQQTTMEGNLLTQQTQVKQQQDLINFQRLATESFDAETGSSPDSIAAYQKFLDAGSVVKNTRDPRLQKAFQGLSEAQVAKTLRAEGYDGDTSLVEIMADAISENDDRRQKGKTALSGFKFSEEQIDELIKSSRVNRVTLEKVSAMASKQRADQLSRAIQAQRKNTGDMFRQLTQLQENVARNVFNAKDPVVSDQVKLLQRSIQNNLKNLARLDPSLPQDIGTGGDDTGGDDNAIAQALSQEQIQQLRQPLNQQEQIRTQELLNIQSVTETSLLLNFQQALESGNISEAKSIQQALNQLGVDTGTAISVGNKIRQLSQEDQVTLETFLRDPEVTDDTLIQLVQDGLANNNLQQANIAAIALEIQQPSDILLAGGASNRGAATNTAEFAELSAIANNGIQFKGALPIRALQGTQESPLTVTPAQPRPSPSLPTNVATDPAVLGELQREFPIQLGQPNN